MLKMARPTRAARRLQRGVGQPLARDLGSPPIVFAAAFLCQTLHSTPYREHRGVRGDDPPCDKAKPTRAHIVELGWGGVIPMRKMNLAAKCLVSDNTYAKGARPSGNRLNRSQTKSHDNT
jgi:hypothetical protein